MGIIGSSFIHHFGSTTQKDLQKKMLRLTTVCIIGLIIEKNGKLDSPKGIMRDTDQFQTFLWSKKRVF